MLQFALKLILSSWLICTVFSFILSCHTTETTNWQNADRSSSMRAPDPKSFPGAIVQVYYARAFSWRGLFGVHPWIAYKEEGATEYHVLQVIGWRVNRGLSVVVDQPDVPDRKWYGATPTLHDELRGEAAKQAIPKILAAAESYPYKNTYRIWPGPNSNTFVAHIIRDVPELNIELPPHAIGKDWLSNGWPIAMSQSGTGAQVSLFGLLGMTVGMGDGLEINILGFGFGFDVLRPALKLPFIGRIGFQDAAI